MNRNTPHIVRYEANGVNGPRHGSSALYAWLYQMRYGSYMKRESR